MARRNNRIAISAGPGWTNVFQTTRAASPGTDGVVGASDVLLSCASDSSNPLEYRVEDPADPAGEVARLAPGDAVRLHGSKSLIQHIVMRGVGGAAVGGVEVLAL